MADSAPRKLNRRTFLKRSAIAAAAGAAGVGAASYFLGGKGRVSRAAGKKVIVIGIDGMDPRLCESMMREELLPNLAKLRDGGGFSTLGTSIPPQSPVAWANFINGAGPGSHGIFDFIHRHPDNPTAPFYGAAESLPGAGGWEVGEHRLPLEFWPFNHQPPTTVLRRQGVPFWDFLDAQGIPTTFYDLPCNYPPSPSGHGHHRCLCGMGTPDMFGSGAYGTYQHFAEDGPAEPVDESGGRRSRLAFSRETARAALGGPDHGLLRQPRQISVEFLVHRDREANAAVIEIQGRRILLRAGEWSRWIKLDFELTMPWFAPNKHVSGICRFYLQEVSPNCRLYVSPVNFDPAAPATRISEPPSFVQDISGRVGPFHTTGFKEAYGARKSGVFSDEEFIRQADQVLEERLRLFEYAVNNYDDGLLFFYFSSSDLQSHILWWNSDDEHPTRTAAEARSNFGHIRRLYIKLDQVIGKIVDDYGSQATIIVMSDHGFADFGKQFNLNFWLREQGFLVAAPDCTSILHDDMNWSQSAAYGLGLNGLYLNLKGRERDGVIEPGEVQVEVLRDLKRLLEEVTDPESGQRVIRSVYRADEVYSGSATALAPDLIVGYARGYRASWSTVVGGLRDTVRNQLNDQAVFENDQAWSADHCADALEVPGVLFCNRPIRGHGPRLVDIAPAILAEFGLATPSSMVGKNIFE